MKLLLGSHVRENGRRVGRLAGFELEAAGRRIRRIIFSADGELGPQTMTRPLVQVAAGEGGGDVEIRPGIAAAPLPAVPDIILLTRATRLKRGGREVGRLCGIAVNDADGRVVSVFGRQHWWSRRFSLDASTIDTSTPGEISVREAGASHAA